jgi:phosphoenolpyruvate synthase/pyruvate phosphate dikinase
MMSLPMLGDATANDPLIVGRKAAALSRLSTLARVPEGFCVPGSIAAAQLPDAVASAYAILCRAGPVAVAVRSSGTDEDGADASFAGQYETVLNVSGSTDIVRAVMQCRESADAAAVAHYRRAKGLRSHSGALPVLVQRLVPAETSAVAFSADPVTGNAGRIVVNANWGLGESIVSGRVTPDSFVVCKQTFALLARTIAAKASMTVATPDGIANIPVPVDKRNRASLDSAQLNDLAWLVRTLETTLGGAVDVECSFADGMLWLLQCRPVTTQSNAGRRQ